MSTTEDIVGRYVKVNGSRLFYDSIGEGLPIVFVHTAGANSLEYTYLLPIMADRGFHAIALDLPGRGRSYPHGWKPNRSIHEHSESVHQFIRALGLAKPVLSGSSIGGDITLDYVAHHHRETLAAIPMEGAARTPTFPVPTEFMYPANGPGWQDIMERVSSASLNKKCSPEKVTELRWIHRNAQVSAVGDLEGWATHDVRGKLGEVSCPVLLVKGVDDFWLPTELVDETSQELPNAEVAVLDGIGHYPMFEDPERIADLIIDFLERHNIRPGAPVPS